MRVSNPQPRQPASLWLFRGLPLLLLFYLCLPAKRLSAQVSLADDIIMAAQGKENAERSEIGELGRPPGSTISPFRRTPGSRDIVLGADPNRRARRSEPPPPLYEADLMAPLAGDDDREGLPRPALERLPLAGARQAAPRQGRQPHVPPAAPLGDEGNDLFEPEGPPNGLSLDAAIERLVHTNRELRTKQYEIPQAEADIVTAGLRSNPLLFYSTDNVPYGSYSRQRPGGVNSGVSVVYPIDYSGKRKARVAVANEEKRVLVAQYQDAVRHEIDHLASDYVDVLAARRDVRSSEHSLSMAEELLRAAGARAAGDEQIDDLIIERDIAIISLGDARQRYQKAKERLAARLDIPAGAAERLELRGTLRVTAAAAPPMEELVNLALRYRPDLTAHRLGVERARADVAQERAERFSDAYFLYSPFLYQNNSATGQQNATSWGAGVFASAPIFNRNQGNLRRADLNVAQSQTHVGALERKVVSEVRQAATDLANTTADLDRLEHVTLPAVRRKRERARAQMAAGRIDLAQYLEVLRDTAPLLRYYDDAVERHRRHMLRLNTVVGRRVLP